ncbi:hypothetical protein ACRYCC_30200 [Actinomadura scrupuli]|uniref:hypothetical protein n=1 Tax=Actinomadura scrupuli TaxID=559629 RepID=UPI003D98081D
MTAKPVLRVTRSSVFAAVCVSLAIAGHATVSHAAVGPWALGFGFAAVLAVAWVLTGTERSLVTILGGLLGGQFALHVLFAAAQPGAPAMDHSGSRPDLMAAEHGGGTAMTLAHIGAAVVSAWWLRRGERAVWVLARRTAALTAASLLGLLGLLCLLDPPPVRAATRAVSHARALARPRMAALRYCVVRRGPPLRSTALALG